MEPPEILQTIVKEGEAAKDEQELNEASPKPSTSIPSPSPSPIPLLPDDGTKGTYQVSQGEHTGPSFVRVIFDPLDAHKGDSLKITAYLSKDEAANQISGTFTSDNTTSQLTLTKESDSSEYDIWTTTLNLTDTVDYQYILTLKAQNGSGVSSISVAPRSR